MRHMLILPLLGSAMLTSCQKEETKAEPPRPVLSQIAVSAEAATLSLPGTVQPKIETQLGFRVLGRVIARNVSVGDAVRKGDVIAAIDPLSLELAVRSSQSELASSQAQLANAVSTEVRQQTLAEVHSGSQATLEEAQQARRIAVAAVGKAKANLDKGQEQLGYAKLLAEFDGIVTAISVEVGQVVSAGGSVATIAKPDERDAVIDVPEGSFAGMEQGSPFDVSLQLDPSIRVRGVVREIAPEVEATTRTSRTKITLIDPPSAFRLGSVITATASVPSRPSIVMPSSAVLIRDGKPNVWLVDSGAGKVSLHAVEVDGPIVEGGSARISAGIKPGDRVVVAGVHKLTDGQAIRIDQGDKP